jgi:hypothetical protein
VRDHSKPGFIKLGQPLASPDNENFGLGLDGFSLSDKSVKKPQSR